MTNDATHVYMGIRSCGHVIMLAVDDGSASVARDVAGVIRRGGRVERVTLEQARASAVNWCKCPPAPKSKRSKRP